jgi:hypothetical protein
VNRATNRARIRQSFLPQSASFGARLQYPLPLSPNASGRGRGARYWLTAGVTMNSAGITRSRCAIPAPFSALFVEGRPGEVVSCSLVLPHAELVPRLVSATRKSWQMRWNRLVNELEWAGQSCEMAKRVLSLPETSIKNRATNRARIGRSDPASFRPIPASPIPWEARA